MGVFPWYNFWAMWYSLSKVTMLCIIDLCCGILRLGNFPERSHPIPG